jgi:hypothetical protein
LRGEAAASFITRGMHWHTKATELVVRDLGFILK